MFKLCKHISSQVYSTARPLIKKQQQNPFLFFILASSLLFANASRKKRWNLHADLSLFHVCCQVGAQLDALSPFVF